MRLKLIFPLPEVTLETDSGHGNIDRVWFDGKDYADKSLAEFAIAAIGYERISDAIAQAELEIQESTNNGPE